MHKSQAQTWTTTCKHGKVWSPQPQTNDIKLRHLYIYISILYQLYLIYIYSIYHRHRSSKSTTPGPGPHENVEPFRPNPWWGTRSQPQSWNPSTIPMAEKEHFANKNWTWSSLVWTQLSDVNPRQSPRNPTQHISYQIQVSCISDWFQLYTVWNPIINSHS